MSRRSHLGDDAAAGPIDPGGQVVSLIPNSVGVCTYSRSGYADVETQIPT
jgi:hypothetical protein